jgi:hypothetical protein
MQMTRIEERRKAQRALVGQPDERDGNPGADDFKQTGQVGVDWIRVA